MTHAEQLREFTRENGNIYRERLGFNAEETAALLAGAEALERAAWRPIADAPKDGSVVIICDYKRPWSQRIVLWWEGAWELLEGQGGSYMDKPTHFMPLPAPPKEDE